MMLRLFSRSLLAGASLGTAVGVAALGVAALGAPTTLNAQSAASTASPAAKPDTGSRGLPIDGIAAVVGDQVILVSELMTAVNQARASGAKVESAADLAKLEADILERLIDAELLVQKAKAEKVEVQDGDITSAVDDQERNVRKRFKSDAEFKAALKEAGMGTIEEWRKITGDQLRRDKLQQQVMQKLQRDGKVTSVNVSED